MHVQVKLLKDVGYDYAFNYKTHSKHEALDEAAPDGIDIYCECTVRCQATAASSCNSSLHCAQDEHVP